jgi:hypothetical protein
MVAVDPSVAFCVATLQFTVGVCPRIVIVWVVVVPAAAFVGVPMFTTIVSFGSAVPSVAIVTLNDAEVAFAGIVSGLAGIV